MVNLSAPSNAMNTPFLSISQLQVKYQNTTVLHDIELNVKQGEFIALLGSSGCGKTTLLRTIAGFIQPTQGNIIVNQQNVTSLPPEQRHMSLVFQSYALWPHMTVTQNIGYGLRLLKMDKKRIAERVQEMLNLVGLTEFATRKPSELSGGQRQRVALARALAVNPQILLLDEPLSNLDARIRLSLRQEIRALQQRLGITAIIVTHDREEAMSMADRVVILDRGHLVQIDTPEGLYKQPNNEFVAAFMGAENQITIEGIVQEHILKGIQQNGIISCQIPAQAQWQSGQFSLRYRPNNALIVSSSETPTAGLTLQGIVQHQAYLGGQWQHTINTGKDTMLINATQAHSVGDMIHIHVPQEHMFIFPATHTSHSSRN